MTTSFDVSLFETESILAVIDNMEVVRAYQFRPLTDSFPSGLFLSDTITLRR